MVLAVLPGFSAGDPCGCGGARLDVEGASDAFSAFLKFFSGWYSGSHRPAQVVSSCSDIFLPARGLSIFTFAFSWVPILLGRIVSWFGKGIRGSLRDAMLSESIAPEDRGKAFGFHRAGDTVGAILGPLAGVWLLSMLPATMPDAPFRTIFKLSLIPGLCAPLAFALLVRETKRVGPSEKKNLRASLEGLTVPYRRFLLAVGIFGSGDFSPTLLTLAAATLLRPAYGAVRAAEIAALLYVVRNVVYAAAAFPIGELADRAWRRYRCSPEDICGAAIAAAATAFLFTRGSATPVALGAVFMVSGVFAAAQDTMVGAVPADLAGAAGRGTVYGTLGAVNGVGDLIASGLVGTLWTVVSPVAAFATAAAIMTAGAFVTSTVQVR